MISKLTYVWPQGDNHDLVSKRCGSFPRTKIMDSVHSNQMFSDFTTFSNHGSMGYDFSTDVGDRRSLGKKKKTTLRQF